MIGITRIASIYQGIQSVPVQAVSEFCLPHLTKNSCTLGLLKTQKSEEEILICTYIWLCCLTVL